MAKRTTKLEPYTCTAPSHWASYLINGDATGLEPDDIEACDAWLKFDAMGSPVSCEDAGFMRWHDANRFALACDCQTYTFLVLVERRG